MPAVAYQLSKQDIIKELMKCGRDPAYFIYNYARISHPARGLIPFKLYDFQKDILRKYVENRFNIILKSRQMGISTLTAAYAAWLALFHRDKSIVAVATKLDVAARIVKKAKLLIKNLPKWMQISEIVVDNRNSFQLKNNSEIRAVATTTDVGHSESLSLLIVDEAAIIENMSELWAGLYPTLSQQGKCIVISTPKGVSTWYHTTYVDAELGRNDFIPTKLMWTLHPDRDEAWFNKETKNMSKKDIATELLCSFSMSGDSVIDPEDIERIEKETVCDPKFKQGVDKGVWVWEEYSDTMLCALCVDVARGDGQDFSTFHVVDFKEMKVVAEYQGKLDYEIFASLLFDTGMQYGGCMIVVENNNLGYSVLKELINKKYPNLYWSMKGSGEYVEQSTAEFSTNCIPGFTTSPKSRPLILAKLEEFIRNKLITIRSVRTLNELRTFVWVNGRPEASRGSNDDLVMPLAIACWIRDTVIFAGSRDIEYKKACIDAICRIGTVFDTKIHGQEGYSPKKSIWKEFPGRNSDYNKLSWIFKG